MRLRATLAAVLLASVASAASAAVVSPARADTPPSLWESAKSPGARDRYGLHVQAQRVLALARDPRDARIALQRFGQLDHLRAILEENGAETSPDVRLRFDLGETYEELELHQDAIRVLAPAIAAHEDDPAALQVMPSLAGAYAKLNRRKEERDVYVMYLRHETDPGHRVQTLGNLAESEMGLMNMKGAIAGYEEVITLVGQLPSIPSAHASLALAEWGLAVALDRSGDPTRAKAEARKAISVDPGMRILNSENVFFVPGYERLWYIALGAAAAAETADTLKDAVELRQVAETCFLKYASVAPSADPWVGLAKVRLTEAEKLRKAAEKKLASAPKKPAEPDPEKVFNF